MTYEHLSVSIWTILDLSGSYSRVLVNSDLLHLSVWGSILSSLACLSVYLCQDMMYSICSLTNGDAKEQIVRFHFGSWSTTQQNYSTIKKEILSIIWCVSKLQNDLFNQKFLIIVDCKSAKEVLQKDVQNLVSKRSFARWQAILSVFDFDIGYIREKIILGNPFMALLYPF